MTTGTSTTTEDLADLRCERGLLVVVSTRSDRSEDLRSHVAVNLENHPLEQPEVQFEHE